MILTKEEQIKVCKAFLDMVIDEGLNCYYNEEYDIAATFLNTLRMEGEIE